jgi:hypothetical protein
MLRFDRVLIAPTRVELERALNEAAKSANKGSRTRKVNWSTTQTDVLLQEVDSAAEGFRQWNGEGERKQRGFGNDTRSAVAVSWWTDPLKRRHYRIGADRVLCASGNVEHLF